MQDDLKESQSHRDPITDPDECHKKWTPVTKSMEGRNAYLAAWAMEREAKFLQAQSDAPETKALIGPVIKYMFPVIRMVLSDLTVLDEIVGVDDRAALAAIFDGYVKTSCEAILETEAGYGRRDLEAQPEDLLGHELVVGLAGRLADATLCYPRMN
jgi:hypothetical protein